jgi:hypothetical protein
MVSYYIDIAKYHYDNGIIERLISFSTVLSANFVCESIFLFFCSIFVNLIEIKMTFFSDISLNSNWGIFQILYRIITSGEIINCENAKRAIYER